MADLAMLPIHFEHSVWAMKKDVSFTGRADQQTMVQYAVPAKIAGRCWPSSFAALLQAMLVMAVMSGLVFVGLYVVGDLGCR